MPEIIRASSDELRFLVASCNQTAKELESVLSRVGEINERMEQVWGGTAASKTCEQITDQIRSAKQLYQLLYSTATQLEETAQKYDTAEQELIRSFYD